MPESIQKEPIQFKSEIARVVFDSLIDFFIEDYMINNYVSEKSGWRTLAEIAQKAHVSPSSLYGKTSTMNQSLDEPIRRGFVETRVFPGERGRGGEVLRLRITYEKDPIKEIVSKRIRLGKVREKESSSLEADPLEEKIVEALRESPLLSTMREDQIREIVKISEKPTFLPDEFIVREGDIASGFFIIIDGQVEAKQRGKSLRKMGRGQFFGETSLAENETRSADVIAIQPTMCLKLKASRLRELINFDPQIAVKLLEETVKRNRGITRSSSSEQDDSK